MSSEQVNNKPEIVEVDCSECAGTGEVYHHKSGEPDICKRCNGIGYYEQQKLRPNAGNTTAKVQPPTCEDA